MMSWKLRLPFTSQYILNRYMQSGHMPKPSSSTKPCPPCPKGTNPGLFRALSFFALGTVALLSMKTYMSIKDHKAVGPEFIRYEYMRIRTKRFAWGDGDKSFFHNPEVNALSDGYEQGHGPPPKKVKKSKDEDEGNGAGDNGDD